MAYLIELGVKGVQVDKEINSHVSKCRHAAAVVGGRIDMVHAYGIGVEILHQLCIAFTLRFVDERVKRNELICNA